MSPKSSTKSDAASAAKSSNNPKLMIRLSKSLLGRSERQCKVAKALGLTKVNDTVVHYDTPTIRGMIRKIAHLLIVEVA